MKNYEVILERSQPTCGGKAPKEVKVMTVSVEDPIQYVKDLEKTEQVDVTVKPDGEIVVNVELGAKRIKYSFSED